MPPMTSAVDHGAATGPMGAPLASGEGAAPPARRAIHHATNPSAAHSAVPLR